jgi:hypothetical protein
MERRATRMLESERKRFTASRLCRQEYAYDIVKSAPLLVASAGKNMHMSHVQILDTVLQTWWFNVKQGSGPLRFASASKNMHMILFCLFGGLV